MDHVERCREMVGTPSPAVSFLASELGSWPRGDASFWMGILDSGPKVLFINIVPLVIRTVLDCGQRYLVASDQSRFRISLSSVWRHFHLHVDMSELECTGGVRNAIKNETKTCRCLFANIGLLDRSVCLEVHSCPWLILRSESFRRASNHRFR